jgi:sec-independent protein translocase protein TatC
MADASRWRRAAREPRQPNDGRMTLVEHLREFRTRLFRSILAILAGSVVGWFFYDQIFSWLDRPFEEAARRLTESGSPTTLALTGVADAFNIQLQVALSVGVVLAAPVWLYQVFRFVTPGLHRHERRWALTFVAFALPLFLAGAVTAYVVLPNVLGALLGFTPHGVTNIISVDHYMGFLLQLMVVFGIGCVAPVVVVVLNLVGILSARRFASWWRWVLIIILVFAAIATPTGDPFNMLLFATPIAALMLIAFVICWVNDRRRARREATALAELGDDEISPLDLTPSPIDDLPSDTREFSD